jgi:hypothetical protein
MRCLIQALLALGERRQVTAKGVVQLDHDINIAVAADVSVVLIGALKIDLVILAFDRRRVSG